MAPRVWLPLIGSAVLAAFSVASLPWSNGWRWPRTPFDASASANAVASGYALLRSAGALVPPGATVVVVTEPRDPIRDGYFQRFGIALLPRARVLTPPPPPAFGDAAFLIVVGSRPASAPGELVLDTPEGTVWRRR